MAKLVDIKKICKALNYEKEEIEDLMRKKMIPHITYADGKILFPLEEVLARFDPKPKSKPKPKLKKSTRKTSKPKIPPTMSMSSGESAAPWDLIEN